MFLPLLKLSVLGPSWVKEVTGSVVARHTEGTRSAAMTVNDTKAAIRTFKACIKETHLSSATSSQLSLQTLSDQNFYTAKLLFKLPALLRTCNVTNVTTTDCNFPTHPRRKEHQLASASERRPPQNL